MEISEGLELEHIRVIVHDLVSVLHPVSPFLSVSVSLSYSYLGCCFIINKTIGIPI